MRKWIYFCAIFLFGLSFLYLSPSSKYRYKLAVCAIFKNEAPWLKEWIEYHRVLGADHFYLYNNDSTDNYSEVLSPYVKEGLVELIDWSSSVEEHKIKENKGTAHEPYQTAAYNDCLKKKALGIAKWVAVIDIDEFIVPVHGARSFQSMLNRMDKQNRGSLKLHWKMFGTSDTWELSPNIPMVQHLTHRAKDDFQENKQVKSIHRPEAVEFCFIHHAQLKEGFKKKKFDPNEFRVHHYWTRSGKSCAEKRGLTKENGEEYLNVLNSVEDTTIFQYLPELKTRLQN
ncbi:MAG TPA: glycosyltransferase family 92 protein [Rhabdochlamydiaceae bacterium]|nr:glycosyltransferase family 92 protein [Rhabdochlamydiaceae bacterium]